MKQKFNKIKIIQLSDGAYQIAHKLNDYKQERKIYDRGCFKFDL